MSMALTGLKVIEFAGIAPGPFAGLVLADHGASVTRVDRPSSSSSDILCRGKRSIVINSKSHSGRELLKQMISSADVVIDPYRPGVMEKMGLGPDVFLGDRTREGLNKKLIYARIAGFPRNGPHKDMAGHDINFIALSGVLSLLTASGKPSVPLNLLGDIGGGGLMCVLGILLALIVRETSGNGQVINTDMVSGTRYFSTYPLLSAQLPSGTTILGEGKGASVLDAVAPYYDVYPCKGGGWMSVGCMEPHFFKVFLDVFLSSLPDTFVFEGGWTPTPEIQDSRSDWPNLSKFIAEGFLSNTKAYWTRVFHGTEACTVPVLSPQEAGRLSNTTVPLPHPSVLCQSSNSGKGTTTPSLLSPGTHTHEVLREYGISDSRIKEMDLEGVIFDSSGLASNVKSKL